MPRGRASLMALLWSLLCLRSASAGAGTAAEAPFSPEEMDRLEHGELLTRPTHEHVGNTPLLGGTSWQVIDRPPEAVWSVLLDPAQLPRTLPQVTNAQVLSENGSDRVLYLEHGNALVRVSYCLDVHIEGAARRITFKVDESRPHDLRTGAGFYWVRPFGLGKTLLIYGVLADLGDRFVASLIRPNVQEWLMKVPLLIKRVVERETKSQSDTRQLGMNGNPRWFSQSENG
jgi:hypothetical protein